MKWKFWGEGRKQQREVDASTSAQGEDFVRRTASNILNSVIGKFNAEQVQKIHEAIDLACSLHGDQKARPDGPYTNHVLRVAERVVNLFGVADSDVIVAALLHDSVEDQAEKLVALRGANDGMSARMQALAYIEDRFGAGVARIVEGVTNAEETEPLSNEEWRRQYVEHVRIAIEDVRVLQVKLSDFMDNGLTIEAVSDPARRLKLAHKYQPLYGIFADRLAHADVVMPMSKDAIITQLRKAEETAQRIIAAMH